MQCPGGYEYSPQSVRSRSTSIAQLSTEELTRVLGTCTVYLVATLFTNTKFGSMSRPRRRVRQHYSREESLGPGIVLHVAVSFSARSLPCVGDAHHSISNAGQGKANNGIKAASERSFSVRKMVEIQIYLQIKTGNCVLLMDTIITRRALGGGGFASSGCGTSES